MSGKIKPRVRVVSPGDVVIVEITEGNYAGTSAVCSRALSLGVYLDMTRNDEDRTPQEVMAANTSLLRRFGREILLEWNLDDRDGNPLPASEEGIMAIPMVLSGALFMQWQGALTGVGAPLGAGSSNGTTSPEASTPKAAKSASPQKSRRPSSS